MDAPEERLAREPETTAIEKFNFHGDELHVARLADGDVGVSLRRLCESLPVDTDSQAKRLAREAAKGARWACTVKMTVHDTSGRCQEMTMLPRRSIPMFAATISLGSVREDLRAGITQKLAAYQDEAADALADHFLGHRGRAATPLTREDMAGIARQEATACFEQCFKAAMPAFAAAVAGALVPLMRPPEAAAPASVVGQPETHEQFMAQERAGILAALNETGWNKRAAAARVQMACRTFYRRLDEYGIMASRGQRRPRPHVMSTAVAPGAAPALALPSPGPLFDLIGATEAQRSILRPLQHLAELRARAVGRPTDRKLIASFRTESETELRQQLSFPHRPGFRWQNLPSVRLGEALLALNSMRVKAERFARRAAGAEQLALPGNVVPLHGRLTTAGG